MKKKILYLPIFILLALSILCSCTEQSELVDMKSGSLDGKRIIFWEDRTYIPFCVVSKNDRRKQIGYVDGDTNDRVSAYKNYPPEEWLVTWLPTDGGAMLMKEISVTDIPDGLEQEY